MRFRSSAAVAVAASLIVVPAASAADGVPLPRRDGVVVAWQAPTRSAVVVTGDQRVYVIRALRRVTPGRRVRVDGIKWGTPKPGIKWGVGSSGIKWGITKAANGTYASRLTLLPGYATTLSLRGTVGKRFGRRGVAITIPGATVAIPFRGAVWLPGGKRANATPLGQFGAKVVVRVTFDAQHRAFSNRVVETAPPVVGQRVPVAGTVVAADPDGRTLTIRSGTAALPVRLTLSVAQTIDMTLFPAGSHVNGTVVLPPSPGPLFSVVTLALNGTFAQADSPVTTVTVPTPGTGGGPGDPPAQPIDPADVAQATTLRDRWEAARKGGQIASDGLYVALSNRLNRVVTQVSNGANATAVAELVEFEARLQTPQGLALPEALRTELAAMSTALRSSLTA